MVQSAWTQAHESGRDLWYKLKEGENHKVHLPLCCLGHNSLGQIMTTVGDSRNDTNNLYAKDILR